VSQNHPGSPTWLHLVQPTTDAAMAAVKRALVMAMVLSHKIEGTLESGKSVDIMLLYQSLQLLVVSFEVQTPSTAANDGGCGHPLSSDPLSWYFHVCCECDVDELRRQRIGVRDRSRPWRPGGV
jgi:hypothetical protein